MHLDTHLASIKYRCKVGGDDSVDALSLSTVYNAAHNLHLVVVDDDVYGEVGLDARSVCYAHNLRKVIKRKVHRRGSTHIELLDTKIY